MGFDDYKVCVSLSNGDMLCFNERTHQVEIVAVTVRPADFKTTSKADIMKLKTKLDERDKLTTRTTR